jgi:aspartyl-tRNA(Asn)/glutamyl-tRNA(Gln) amidotransferase subunit A
MSEWTIASLGDAIAARRLSPVEVVRTCLARVERLDGRLHAFVALDAAGALATAERLEGEAAAGRGRGPLHGIPVAHKDLCAVPGFASACGTRTREYFISEHPCTAAARLTEAGAVTLGKLNMTELALGPFGDNAHTGDVDNPWRHGHCAGGSSSGSAAAVAAGLVLGAIGTDTGGSIRLPAACCGVVGLKPTYGRVSRAGAMPLSWSMDHLGPIARTVRDAALLLGVMAGADRRDATASPRRVPDFVAALARGARGVRIGVPENYYFDDIDPEMEAGVRVAIGALGGLGAAVKSLRVPDPEGMVSVSTVIARAESAAVHARLLKERPQELQPVVRARLEVGLRIAAHDYLQALRLRARLTRRFLADVFGEVDVLATPVIPEPAPALAAATAGSVHDVVKRMGRFSRLTRPFNGLGLPAVSVPCGFSRDGRPLALQIVGRPFAEATVLAVGHAYEQAAGWHARVPPLEVTATER